MENWEILKTHTHTHIITQIFHWLLHTVRVIFLSCNSHTHTLIDFNEKHMCVLLTCADKKWCHKCKILLVLLLVLITLFRALVKSFLSAELSVSSFIKQGMMCVLNVTRSLARSKGPDHTWEISLLLFEHFTFTELAFSCFYRCLFIIIFVLFLLHVYLL